MQAHLHRVEFEPAVELDDDLAIERRVRRHEIAKISELREIAKQRPLVAAPERELAAIVFEHAAKAVPLRLVLPALAFGERLPQLCLPPRERGGWAREQAATRRNLTSSHESEGEVRRPPATGG